MAEAIRQLNLRVSENMIQELDSIANIEQIDRTTLARKLLSEATARWRLQHAITLYEQGQISKERAAELAQVSIYDILDELRRRGTISQYTLDEAQEDITALLARAGFRTNL